MTRAVSMLSGGGGSWGATRRYRDLNPDVDLTLLFTDVGDGTSEFLGEHPDTYRFLHDAAADIGAPLVTLRDGRNVWDVFDQKKWLGNASLSHCSWELKTKPARVWMDEHYDPADTVLILGLDWTETHRVPAVVKNWAPYTVLTPLTEKPYVAKPQLLKQMRDRGLTPPEMYRLGFSHSNCPSCVKAGQGHWKRLLDVLPDYYADAERREQEFRARFGDVSILKDRTGGETQSLSLRKFRERAQADGEQIDLFDIGGCGCFVDDGDVA